MPTAVDLEKMRTFLAIAESGSFTRAAQAVSRTQPAISLQMRQLEERFGRSLFVRAADGVTLTEDGLRLIAHARRLVSLSAEASDAFRPEVLPRAICFGIPADYAETYLPSILASFARVRPDVEVAVHCDNSNALYSAVETGDVDIALVTNFNRVEISIVRREEMIWAGSTEHCIEQADPLPLAMAGPDCFWRASATAALTAAGRNFSVPYVSTNPKVIAAAVFAGLAVTAISRSTIQPGMRVLGQADGLPLLPDNELGVIRSGRGHASAACQTLTEQVASVFI